MIVETVGVGQSETTVSLMTDLFVLMQLPNAGDDLQAIKKGVMELADLVLINKCDLDPNAATRAQAQITSAMRLYGFHGNPTKNNHLQSGGIKTHSNEMDVHGHEHSHLDMPLKKVMQLSALEEKGIEEFWNTVVSHKEARYKSGEWAEKRRFQAISAMWERVDGELKRSFKEYPGVKGLLPGVLSAVNSGTLAPTVAARQLLKAYMGTEFLGSTN